MRCGDAGDLLGSADGNNVSACISPLGAKIDHPIGTLYDVEIMFHNEYGIASIHESFEHRDELPHIGHVQPRRRFIENVERAAGGFLREFSGEFDSLCLSSGKRRRGLSKREIIKPYITERLKFSSNIRHVGKNF